MEPLRCSAFLAMSLDGHIARPDGGLDWLAPFEAEDHGYPAFFDSVQAIVVGRRTYDTVLGFERWPYAGKRCLVLTHRPAPATHGEAFLAGTPPEVVAHLARTGVRRVYVDGGSVVSAFLAAGLLDDLTVSLIPVVLGSGIRLFQGDLPGSRVDLESCRSLPSGVVQLKYRTRSPPTAGR